MKTLYFIRHAKSSWEDASLRDHDRPLNKRGLRDAPFMAKVLKGKGANPDLFMTSSANRAYSTALFFAMEFGKGRDDLRVEKGIYEAYSKSVMDFIYQLDDELQEVAVFGHNPTFTSLINLFNQDYLPNLPTCGIGKVRAEIDHWKHLKPENAQLVELMYPKQYFSK